MPARPNTMASILVRLEPVTESGCLLWTGLVNTYGYGRVRYGGKECSVHRLIWQWQVGPIPDGLVIDHLCRVRCCGNVRHMEVVTNKENLLRGESCSAQCARQTTCRNGHPLIQMKDKRACVVCREQRRRELRASKRTP